MHRRAFMVSCGAVLAGLAGQGDGLDGVELVASGVAPTDCGPLGERWESWEVAGLPPDATRARDPLLFLDPMLRWHERHCLAFGRDPENTGFSIV